MSKTINNRRGFVRNVGLGALGLTISGARLSSASSSKPNIIYILLDDAGWGDLSCYGQKRFSTPNIDQLAADGIRFTDHYAASPVCAPSRCCLMTGLHTGHAPIRGNRENKGGHGQTPLPDGTVTIPKLLRRAGYRTGAFGKWGLGANGSTGDPLRQGFDEFFGYLCQRQAHNYYPDYLWSNGERVELDGETYSHDLIMERSFDFIGRNRDNPFFCYMPVTIPHASLHVPEESARPFRRKFPRFELVPGVYSGRVIRNPAACFAGMMTRLDGQVGFLIELLKSLGIDDNTVVMLASDNGPHMEGGAMPGFFNGNGPFRGKKRDLYEGGIRVPMIARWPGRIAPGTISDLPSAFWDVMPTLTDIAGTESPDGIDGISMLPTLLGRNAAQERHEYLYWEFPSLISKQAVRMENWKALRMGLRGRGGGDIRLFNLEEDPGETQNVASNHPEIVARAENVMRAARTESKDFELF